MGRPPKANANGGGSPSSLAQAKPLQPRASPLPPPLPTGGSLLRLLAVVVFGLAALPLCADPAVDEAVMFAIWCGAVLGPVCGSGGVWEGGGRVNASQTFKLINVCGIGQFQKCFLLWVYRMPKKN